MALSVFEVSIVSSAEDFIRVAFRVIYKAILRTLYILTALLDTQPSIKLAV